jgi:cell division septation protein DedD
LVICRMRRLKADVSHRIRRRRPSIFAARWFRLLLGGGVAIVLALLVGPPVTGWLLRDRMQVPVVLEPGIALSRTAPGVSPPAPAPDDEPRLMMARMTADAPVPEPRRANDHPPAARQVLFRVQVGAFLDHRNADRLVERLRGEDLEVSDWVVEHSREFYRVIAMPREEEGYEALLERLRALGFTSEPSEEGAAVTAPVGLHQAVELSRRLRDAEILVRLDRVASASVFRVVRVGRFTSAEAAERARTELRTRGVEGFVVREP